MVIFNSYVKLPEGIVINKQAIVLKINHRLFIRLGMSHNAIMGMSQRKELDEAWWKKGGLVTKGNWWGRFNSGSR